ARLIVIDDYADGYLPAHAIVNPNPHAYLCRYDTAMDTRTVLGAPFALVRPDVVFARDRAVDSGAWPRVVVSPGAFDADGAARVVAALDALSDPFTLVVTASVDAPGAGAMREAAASNHHPTTIVLSPEDVGATYAGAAVGVCTSPVSAAEFACLGVPGVYLPRNARDASAFAVLGRMGAGVAAGRAGAFDADGLSRVVRAMLRPNGPRSTLAKNARALVDGKGAARALGKLSKYNVLPLAVPDIP
ncbi:hypothetical protein K8I61_18895, partial [bacterium]|nr:hypothetical protein [bacterium]